jgi:transposase, IS30 family
VHEKQKRFAHLSASERNEISILNQKGYSLRDIAQALSRSVSTISDEMNRNKIRNTYEPKKADQKADTRRKQSKYQGMRIVEHSGLREFVEEMLYDDQSPANIAGRIKKHEKHLPTVSKDSIYRFIESVYGRRIESHRKNRKKKPSRHRGRLTALSDRTFIDERPKHINARMRVGDVEADFIVSGKSGKGILLVVVDRKLRVVFIEQILEVSIAHMHKAFLLIQQRFPEMRTITTDNDILFKHHKLLAELLRVRIYFCHPYHSWEKGTVENANGVIRDDVPKGSDISQYSKRFIQGIEDKLNRRILECLDYLTPAEVLAVVRKRKNARGV